MRLTSILAITVAAILHSSATSLSSVTASMAAIENGVLATADSTFAEGGRLLRRVDSDEDLDDEDLDDDDLDDKDIDHEAFDEERNFVNFIKKLNPVAVVKKYAERAKKIKQAQKEATDKQKLANNWLSKPRGRQTNNN